MSKELKNAAHTLEYKLGLSKYGIFVGTKDNTIVIRIGNYSYPHKTKFLNYKEACYIPFIFNKYCVKWINR